MDLEFRFLKFSSCAAVMVVLILNHSRALSTLMCKVWKRLSERIPSLSVLLSSVELWLAAVYFCLTISGHECTWTHCALFQNGGYFNLVSRYFTILVERLEKTVNVSSSLNMSYHACPSLKCKTPTKRVIRNRYVLKHILSKKKKKKSGN